MILKKIIFLDIDGVLWPYESDYPKDEYGYLFKKESVEALRFIIEKSGGVIVVSSSWKTMGLSALKEMWEIRKLPGQIISITPEYHNEYLEISDEPDPYKYSRGYEIDRWLRSNTNSKYLIIDDLNDFSKEHEKNLITPKPNEGLTMELAREGIKILNS